MSVTFDLQKYLSISKRLDTDDLDWETVRDYPVSEAEIRVLKYFMDIETYTIIYLKELLSTPAAHDPEITAFLGCWNYEEYFHGYNLERFLKAYGVDVENSAGLVKQNENLLNKFWLLGMDLFSKALDWRFIGVHMTWGAINELTTLYGYQALIEHTKHPLLKEMFSRIVKDERRHFSFYYNQAKMRLEDPFVRWLTRTLIDRFWTIVGTGQKSDTDVDHVVHTLFSGDFGRKSAIEMDKVMGALPGFDGFNGVVRMLDRHMAKFPPTTVGSLATA